jgi:HK97 family phage major capsid protein
MDCRQMSLQQITDAQKKLCEKASKEGRGFSDSEESYFQELQRAYEYNSDSSIRAGRELWLGGLGLPELETRNQRRDKMETTKLDMTKPEIREYVNYMISGKTESRALQKDLDVGGGFLVLPEYLTSQIVQALDNQVFIRPLATTFRVKADSVGIPVLDHDLDDPQFAGEISPTSLDEAMNFEKRRLIPKRCCKGIKWSRTLNSIGVINLAQFLNTRLIYKLGVVEENCFLNGSGANEPLGLFTTSADGVSSSRNVSEGASTTEVKADTLIAATFFLKPQYLADKSCRWIFHRSVMKQIRKLKDGDGNYLFGFDAAGVPRILGIPVIQSEYAPSTMSSGLRIGMLGPLSFYGIAEHDEYKLQTLTELYALTNQNASLIEKWVDGGPLLEEAFAAITLA